MNPIELAFAKIKNHLRISYATSAAGQEGRPRTRHELIAAINQACDQISTTDIDGWFRKRSDESEHTRVLTQLLKHKGSVSETDDPVCRSD